MVAACVLGLVFYLAALAAGTARHAVAHQPADLTARAAAERRPNRVPSVPPRSRHEKTHPGAGDRRRADPAGHRLRHAPTTTAVGDAAGGGPTKVKLQLQWFTQAQFAGYFAAVDQGFYRDEGLDVEILEGGVDIVPQTVLAQGQADYAIAWVPKALASREQGAQITDVGQIFQRSGT